MGIKGLLEAPPAHCLLNDCSRVLPVTLLVPQSGVVVMPRSGLLSCWPWRLAVSSICQQIKWPVSLLVARRRLVVTFTE